MIACFHEHLAQELWIGTLSGKIMQILNNDSPIALRAIPHYEPWRQIVFLYNKLVPIYKH